MNIFDKIIHDGLAQLETWEQAQEDKLIKLENALLDDPDIDPEEADRILDEAREKINQKRESGEFTD